jgi:hypothetical protein
MVSVVAPTAKASRAIRMPIYLVQTHRRAGSLAIGSSLMPETCS